MEVRGVREAPAAVLEAVAEVTVEAEGEVVGAAGGVGVCGRVPLGGETTNRWWPPEGDSPRGWEGPGSCIGGHDCSKWDTHTNTRTHAFAGLNRSKQ